jgi:uncharacterized protein (TIGR02611 family)
VTSDERFSSVLGENCPDQMVARIARTAAGGVLLLAGIAMLVLPGPGWLTIAAGLAILATEFAWARRALDQLKDGASWLGRKFKVKTTK